MLISRKQSFILAAGVLVLFFLFSILFLQRGTSLMDQADRSSVSESGDSDPTDLEEDPQLQIVLREFRRSETKDGKKLWEVVAKEGRYLPEQSTAEVSEATLWVFQEDGDTVILEAERAVLHLKGASLLKAELLENVKLVYDKEISVSTEHAIYDQQLNSVTAPGTVRIQSALLDITGDGLLADIVNKTAVLQRDVHTVISGRNNHD